MSTESLATQLSSWQMSGQDSINCGPDGLSPECTAREYEMVAIRPYTTPSIGSGIINGTAI